MFWWDFYRFKGGFKDFMVFKLWSLLSLALFSLPAALTADGWTAIGAPAAAPGPCWDTAAPGTAGWGLGAGSDRPSGLLSALEGFIGFRGYIGPRGSITSRGVSAFGVIFPLGGSIASRGLYRLSGLHHLSGFICPLGFVFGALEALAAVHAHHSAALRDPSALAGTFVLFSSA